jgi:DNA/RNA-binding domain of Phe-tRNA-synthetase-like protein
MQFTLTPDVQNIGLTGTYFTMSGLRNKDGDVEFSELAEKAIADILPTLNEQTIENDLVLQGFRDLHAKVGKTSKKYAASPENLLRYLLEYKSLPHVNLIVDIYNLVSIKSKLALGAHNAAHIAGNVNLRLTAGSEHFVPLGYTEPKPVSSGDYAYIDDANDILCWLEVRQVEKTKVTLDTTECFYIVQGNANTPAEYLKQTSDELISLTKQFCGGQEEFLYTPW